MVGEHRWGSYFKKIKTYEERMKKVKLMRIKEQIPEEDFIMAFGNMMEFPWSMGLILY